MHATLLDLVPFVVSLCSARPAQHDTSQTIPLDFTAPPLGNLARNLANVDAQTIYSRQLGDGSSNLTLPLKPSQYPHLRSEITYGFDDVPIIFLELPASIAMNIYDAWRDTANLPIQEAIHYRLNPFDDIEFSTIPSTLQGPILTPVKIGLASYTMLNRMGSLRRWPGHVQATIFDATMEIGTLKVDNSPLVTGSLSVGSSANNRSREFSFTGFHEQQRWLRCFTNVLARLLIQKSPPGRVTDHPHLSPKQIPWGYRWSCGVGSDEYELRIYPAGNAGSPHELTWGILFEMMLRWINQVARGTGSQYGVVLQEDGVQTAALLILFGTSSSVGSDELDDHVAATS